jgi:hypothetical protein
MVTGDQRYKRSTFSFISNEDWKILKSHSLGLCRLGVPLSRPVTYSDSPRFTLCLRHNCAGHSFYLSFQSTNSFRLGDEFANISQRILGRGNG